jgi:cytosine/adenosine deaminase-related metal-dependent hydrolase
LDLRLYWCFCPNANLYITGSLPDVEPFRDSGQTIVLGTDSLASNQQLSILAEMQTIRSSFPSIGVSELLGWASINGAKALQMEDSLGSFETGKQPGAILVGNDLSAVRVLM